jgi:hypothetical protein
MVNGKSKMVTNFDLDLKLTFSPDYKTLLSWVSHVVLFFLTERLPNVSFGNDFNGYSYSVNVHEALNSVFLCDLHVGMGHLGSTDPCLN